MRFYKVLSTILHPNVMPTLGLFIYLMMVPNSLFPIQKYALIGVVFVITYIIPIITLVLLKAMGLINSFQVETIKERRIPILFMIVLFYLLGSGIFNINVLNDIGLLFYGSAVSLLVIYLLFIFKIKSSLHLVSMGISVGFFVWLSDKYTANFLPIIMVAILISGLLASARLHLNAHKPLEIYFGFFIGFISQLALYAYL